jgi:hypothetical protein
VIARDLLTDLHQWGVELTVANGELRYRAPRGVVTPAIRATLSQHKAELVALLSEREQPPTLDPDSGELAAVKLRNTSIGDLWLVADADTVAEHPDIIRSGLPVFFFSEVETLRGKTVAELMAIGMVKTTFPTSRVLQ